MRWALWVASALALWHTSPSHAWQQSAPSSAVLTGNQAVNVSVGCHAAVAYPKPATAGAKKPCFSHVFENPLAEFISLHFTHLDLPPDDYIVLRPTHARAHQPVITIYGKNATGAFFSRALYTKSITLELYTTPQRSTSHGKHCRGFAIDAYRFLADAASFESSQQEQVCGDDESLEAACYRGFPEVFARSNAVARLLIHKDGESYFCSGWLFGCEGHVMTNHHCISQPAHAANTAFEFMAQGSNCSTNCEQPFACPGTTRATTSTLVVADETLDYALVKVDGDLWKDYGYLQMRESGAVMGEKIYIPEHPAGYGKRIAMKDGPEMGTVLALDRGGCLPDQVAYDLDTQGGSSGSPVLSTTDHAVVAIHHCGGCPNTAVNAQKIVQDLRDKNLLPKCALYGSSR